MIDPGLMFIVGCIVGALLMDVAYRLDRRNQDKKCGYIEGKREFGHPDGVKGGVNQKPIGIKPPIAPSRQGGKGYKCSNPDCKCQQ